MLRTQEEGSKSLTYLARGSFVARRASTLIRRCSTGGGARAVVRAAARMAISRAVAVVVFVTSVAIAETESSVCVKERSKIINDVLLYIQVAYVN